MPSAWAGGITNVGTISPVGVIICNSVHNGAFDNPSGQTVANVCVQNTSFTGNITN
jgi:hypothetical protein